MEEWDMGCRIARVALAVGVVAAVLVGPAHAATPTDLGAWDGVGGFRPVAVAGPYVAGTKVIAVAPDEFGHAAIWSGGALTDLTAIGGAGSQRSSGAYDVSPTGLVVGSSNTGDAFAGENAFKGTGPSLVDLGVLDDTVFTPSATARGVNAQGVIVGSSVRGVGATEREQGFRLLSGTLGPAAAIPAGAGDAANDVHLLAISDAPATRAVGVRNWVEQTGAGSGIVVDGTTITALPFVPGRHGISADGRYAAGTTPAGGARRLDLATPGAAAATLAPLAPATTAAASAVTSAGIAVGSSGGRAVAWDGTAAADLNGLLDAGSGWVLQAALDVTDAGVVLGYGTRNGVRHGFLLQLAATGIVVNETGDARDANPATRDGICDADAAAAGRQCTLRAAIETANEPGGDDRITFELPAGAVIRPATALPALTAADAELDGTTSGGGAAAIDGRSVPATRAGIALEGARTRARGLVLGGFGVGVDLVGARTVLEATRIGFGPTGAALPLRGVGVRVAAGASGARIGGTEAGQAVEIAHTAGAGVAIPGAGGASVRGNRIEDTGGLAIDIGAEGSTANPAPGATTGGPSYPILTALSAGRLAGLLGARPSSAYTIDVYDGICAGDRGELARHLESFTVRTDATGVARLDHALATRPGVVVATATDARGATSEPSSARFDAADPRSAAPARPLAALPRAAGATCATDLRALGIEVVQRVQGKDWDRPALTPVTLPGLTGSPLPIAFATRYRAQPDAATLVRGVSTFAKVYLRNDDPAVVPGDVPRVMLYGFARRGASLVPLTPRLVTAEYRPRITGTRALTIKIARTDDYGHLFRLPDAWTRSTDPIVLVASVNADGAIAECRDETCRTNNWVSLEGLTFVRTGAHPITLLRSTWPGRTGAAADETAWLADVERMMVEYQPYAPDRSPVALSAAVLDLTRDIKAAQGLAGIPRTGSMRECWLDEECQNALPMLLTDRAAAVPRTRSGWPLLTTKAGVDRPGDIITGYGPANATWAALDFKSDGDNVARLGHEIGHSIGDLRHVAGCGGGGPDGAYPDPDGFLVSWAFIPPRSAGAPGRTIAPNAAHDVMSYCEKQNAKRRMSLYSWNKAAAHTQEVGPGLAPTPRAGAQATLRVSVVAIPGGRAIVTVSPTTASPSAPATGATAALVARDAAGQVIRTVPIVLASDEAAGGPAFLVGAAVIPAAGVASVAVEQGGRELARVARPAARIGARLLGAPPRVRSGRPTALRVALSGPVADATLQVSTDGRRFTPLVSGLRAGRVVLAPDVLPQGRRLRLRIVATDGFRTVTATGRRFAAPGARPRVTIASPGTGSVYARGARIELVGRAVLRAGGVVTGRRLRWYDGKRLLGRGARLATTRLGRGRHVIALVASAGPRLEGRARVTIRVR